MAEKIKPENILLKHVSAQVHDSEYPYIVNAMCEFAKLSSSEKQERIEELEKAIKYAIESINEFQDGGCSKNVNDAKFYLIGTIH